MTRRTRHPQNFPLVALLQKTWSRLYKPKPGALPLAPEGSPGESLGTAVERHPDDPFWNDLLHAKGVVDLTRIERRSPAVAQLKAAGVQLVAPLISQGELIGLLNLGPRRSEQDYSFNDRRLLSNLAAQTAPALRVAQLARQQQVEARQRERIEQELRIARHIQQTLLPRQLPEMEGWQVSVHWQPARAVGGDFYDFIYYEDGRVGFFIGDVTDKGIPAAMVMATTRTVLRASAENYDTPGEVLMHANNLLCPDIPQNMFITCLYAILDPATGFLRFANAGHNLPYLNCESEVTELRARGMPLGLMPHMDYEEKEVLLPPGANLVFYSDGLTEAHNPQKEMFGGGQLKTLLAGAGSSSDPIPSLLDALEAFTGPDWEQEDDVTLVALRRTHQHPIPAAGEHSAARVLAAIEVASQRGNERLALAQVVQAVAPLQLSPRRLERLKTAVAEAVMNAMEHGNKYNPDYPVRIKVQANPVCLTVTVSDFGNGGHMPDPATPYPTPNLAAKLSGLEPPRGWGLFLIKNMVDQMQVSKDNGEHNLALIFHLENDDELS